MKKILAVLMVVALLIGCVAVLSACSEENNVNNYPYQQGNTNANNKTNNPLIGKWETDCDIVVEDRYTGEWSKPYDVIRYEYKSNGVFIETHLTDGKVIETEKYKYEILDENRVALLDYDSNQMYSEPEKFEVVGNTLILDRKEYKRVK